jgi:hypothetical protein
MKTPSRHNVAATRRRIAQRRRANAADRGRYGGAAGPFDGGERSGVAAAREEAREELLAQVRSAFRQARDS